VRQRAPLAAGADPISGLEFGTSVNRQISRIALPTLFKFGRRAAPSGLGG
jgi:hypothetical protein